MLASPLGSALISHQISAPFLPVSFLHWYKRPDTTIELHDRANISRLSPIVLSLCAVVALGCFTELACAQGHEVIGHQEAQKENKEVDRKTKKRRESKREEESMKMKHHRGAERMRGLFPLLDTDSSGKLDFGEFSKAPKLVGLKERQQKTLFHRLDDNSDGWLEAKELHPSSFSRSLRVADQNEDGQLSYWEYQNSSCALGESEAEKKAHFEKLDQDQDGVLSSREFEKGSRRGHHEIGSYEDRFRAADTDQSGGLLLEEFKAIPKLSQVPDKHLESIFRKIDQNKDAVLTLDEFKSRRKRHDRGRTLQLWRRIEQSGALADGKLKRAELTKLKLPEMIVARMFTRLDQNGDGVIQSSEKPSLRKYSEKQKDKRKKGEP